LNNLNPNNTLDWVTMKMSKLDEAQRFAKWQAEHDRFMQSGLSVAQWCLREGVAKSAFYMRRSRLKVNAVKLKAASGDSSGKASNTVAVRPTFIDAGVFHAKLSPANANATVPNSNATTEVRIDLGGGVVITVNRTGSTLLSEAQ
jgi:hypothetical protein